LLWQASATNCDVFVKIVICLTQDRISVAI
jgi:hypothetical protein